MDLLGLGFKVSILASARSEVKGFRSNVSRETHLRRAIDSPIDAIGLRTRTGHWAKAAFGAGWAIGALMRPRRRVATPDCRVGSPDRQAR